MSARLIGAAIERAGTLAVPGASARPALRLAVLACMDARLDLFAMLGLARGDAHLIRNAGGLASDDAIRSLSASQRMLGTEEVIVVMHDGCGLHGASDERFAAELSEDGAAPAWRLGAFTDVDAALAASLQRLRSAPELPHRDHIRGLVFDPDAGTLREPWPTPAVE